jgi:hypothetical protein
MYRSWSGAGNCSRAPVRGRSWSAAEKATSIAESYGAGETVCGVARRHDLTSQQLFTWRLARQTALSAPTIFILAVERRNRRVRHRLAPATGDSVLGLDLDWPARIAEVAPHFVAHGSTKFVRQGCQCLAGGSAAAFKRAVICVE